MIEKLTDRELIRKLLETRNITLADVLEKARASEAAVQQMEYMAGGSDVNAVRKKGEKTANHGEKICYSCGKSGYFSRDSCCPAKGRKCAKYFRYGHFAALCRGNVRPSPVRDRESRPKETSNNNRRSARQKNHVAGCSEEEIQVDDNPAFAFYVAEEGEEVCMVSVASDPTMDLSISGIVMEVLIDSGLVSNLTGEDYFQTLEGLGFKGDIEHCSKELFAYGGKKVDVIGQFGAEISTGDTKVTTTFILVRHGRCILGNVTAKELGVLHIGLPNALIGISCNEVQGDIADQPKAKYPKVFEGIGKLRDFQLKLHVNRNVPPVAQKLRLRFHLHFVKR